MNLPSILSDRLIDATPVESESVISTVSSRDLWADVDDSTFDRKEAEKYIKTKNLENQVSPNPQVEYLDQTVFPLLKQAIIDMLFKVKADGSFYKRYTTLNGLDYMAEFLYNKNPKFPQREANWTYIFDMDWVKDYLKENPRPHYPFHLIWSREFAALKIQSYLRGHWVRCLPDVQELRQFWKFNVTCSLSRIEIILKTGILDYFVCAHYGISQVFPRFSLSLTSCILCDFKMNTCDTFFGRYSSYS